MNTKKLTKLSQAIWSITIVPLMIAATPAADNDIGSGLPRRAAQLCWSQYLVCGGFEVDGYWDTCSQCELDSGIDQSQ